MAKWRKRIWLNEDKGQVAFIAPSVDASTDDGWITADVKIGDCNRMITLDFGSGTVKDREEVLKKLYLLQEALQQFRQRLVAAHERVEKR